MSQRPDPQPFDGFYSYARRDDENDGGRISKLREVLEREIQAISGTDFRIFQDRTGIDIGEQSGHKIDQTLWKVAVLITVLTPTFLTREACRHEVETFLKREEELGRDDLIIPIFYIELPEYAKNTDLIADQLSRRQYVDWRELRFKRFDSSRHRQAVFLLASQVVTAVHRSRTTPARSARVPMPNRATPTTVFRAVSSTYVRTQDRLVKEFNVESLAKAVQQLIRQRLVDLEPNAVRYEIKPEHPTIPLQVVRLFFGDELAEDWCVHEKI